MKIPKLVLSVAIMSLFGGPIWANTTVDPSTGQNLEPLQVVMADISFIPQEDVTIYDTCMTAQYSLQFPDGLNLPEDLGFDFENQPFVLENGTLTFIPGSYDFEFAGFPPLVVIQPNSNGNDDFFLWGGIETLSLPPTISGTEIDNVPMTINAMPEPTSFAFLGIGILGLLAIRPKMTLR